MGEVRWVRRAAVLWTIVVVAALGFASSASAVQITGFSTQGLGGYTELGQFYEKGLNLPHQRAIVPYDVIDRAGEMNDVVVWVRAAQARGRQVLISFNNNGAPFPDVGTYAAKVAAFRARLRDESLPVGEYTAWNEPNHQQGVAAPHNDPVIAARYWKALNGICGQLVYGPQCTVTAGDFSDPNPTSPSSVVAFNNYVASYKAELASGPDAGTPARWAIHPYSAIGRKDFSAVTAWVNTQTGSADVWLTELGAMFCRADYGYESLAGVPGDASTAAAFQNDRAAALKTSLQGLSARVTRAYYYTLSWPAGGHRTCTAPSYVWDSALLGDAIGVGDVERPAFRTLFPSAPTPQPPAVDVGGATAVTPSKATLDGSVDPRGLQTSYRFEYGPTTGYGNSVPVPPGPVGNGRGAVSVSNALAGLIPATTYHYRLVATNQIGTTYSGDRTFATEPLTRPALFVSDYIHIFGTTESGQLLETINNGPRADDLWRTYDLTWSTRVPVIGEPDTYFDGRYTHVYARNAAGHLIETINNGATPGTWQAYDLTSSTGVSIAGDPAVRFDGRYIHVFARNAAGHLIETINNGATPGTWQAYDLTSSTRVPIAGDPTVYFDGRYTHVYARNAAGHLIETINNGAVPGSWQAYDLTSMTGVPVAGDPALYFDGRYIHLYARNAAGHLIETINNSARPGEWQAYDLTATTRVPIAGDPSVARIAGYVHIYARNAAGHLIETVNNGPRADDLWRAYDLTP